MSEHVVAHGVSIYVGYSKDIVPPTGKSIKMVETTNLNSIIYGYVEKLYRETTYPGVPIRRLGITFTYIMDEGCEGYDLFTDYEAVEKEKRIERAILDLKTRFGKNAMLRAIDLEECATQITRNKYIGGHNGE